MAKITSLPKSDLVTIGLFDENRSVGLMKDR